MSQPHPEPPTTPVPPRYWWLKRFLIAGAALLVVLFGLRLWWDRIAEARLAAKIVQIRDSGEPLFPEDFAVAPVRDEENAVPLLQHAAAARPARSGVADLEQRIADGEDRLDVLTPFVAEHADMLALARAARGRTAADWKVQWTSPAIGISLPDMAAQRELAKALKLVALYRHARNHDAETVETLHDMLALGEHLEASGPFLIPHLVRVAIDALTARTIQSLAPGLSIDVGQNTGPCIGQPATADQVRILIAKLLDEQDSQARLIRAFQGERCCELDAALHLARGQVSPEQLTARGPAGPWAWLFGPAWKLDALAILDYCTAFVRAAEALNWPAAQTHLPTLGLDDYSPMQVVARLPSRLIAPSLDRVIQIHFSSLADRRRAAAELAARWFELEHGRRPATLSELVPRYLPYVPCDPFNPNDGEVQCFWPTSSPSTNSAAP